MNGGGAAILSNVPALPGVEVLAGRHAEHRFSPHWHASWSLAGITAGVCRFTCGGAKWRAGPGDLVLLPPYAVHTAGIGPEGLVMTMVYLPEVLVAELLGLPRDMAPAVDRCVAAAPALAAQLRDAFLGANGNAMEDACRAILRLFHVLAGCRHGPLERPDLEDARIVTLCSALRRNPASRADLDQVAREVGIGREHFQRLFKRVVGLTPAEYERLARLERAKAALRAGLRPAEVAAEAGFADQAHLTRWFRRVYGTTPARSHSTV